MARAMGTFIFSSAMSGFRTWSAALPPRRQTLFLSPFIHFLVSIHFKGNSVDKCRIDIGLRDFLLSLFFLPPFLFPVKLSRESSQSTLGFRKVQVSTESLPRPILPAVLFASKPEQVWGRNIFLSDQEALTRKKSKSGCCIYCFRLRTKNKEYNS